MKFFLNLIISLVCFTLLRTSGILTNESFLNLTFNDENSSKTEVGDALFLTPYIQNGSIKKARSLSLVSGFSKSIKSYSGFITVNSTYNSNLFFWFFPSKDKPKTSPLIIFLNGGRGESTLVPFFIENGPFKVDKNKKLTLRKETLVKNLSVIFIDNPVGSGFSFTDDINGYSKTESEIASNLHIFLTQFFQLFPNYKQQDFYITGFSFAARYLVALGNKIRRENKKDAQNSINFKGVIIGGPSFDDPSVKNRGKLYNRVGLIDLYQLAQNNKIAPKIDARADDVDFLSKITGVKDITNVLEADQYFAYNFSSYIQLSSTRKKLHVGSVRYLQLPSIIAQQLTDLSVSSLPKLTQLINSKENYRILLYSGGLDGAVTAINSMKDVRNLNFTNKNCYDEAKREIWRIGSKVVGYVKKYKNFHYVSVRNAGHHVFLDQPVVANRLYNDFMNKKGIVGEENDKC